MNANDWMREIATQVQRREELRYAWLRHLLLLASGSLSVLVSLRTGAHTVGFQRYCIATALASLGVGILLGAVSLYGEVWTAQNIVKRTVEEGLRQLKNPGTPGEAIASKLPMRYVISERLCYSSLLVSVISLVFYSISGD